MTQPVSAAMHRRIRALLREVETTENIRILFAVESGSRAWGFHSPDSDYDIRFVYARPPDWHFRLGKKRDVIERPIDDEIDLSGWELSKALTLALGSNAVIGEWLQSPIRYLTQDSALPQLVDFSRAALTRKPVSWHYYALAERQMGKLGAPDNQIRLKRFFYVLRPVLALRWMRLHQSGMPPMHMPELIRGTDLSDAQCAALAGLTQQKKQTRERATTAQIAPVLSNLVEQELAITQEWLSTNQPTQPPDLKTWADQLHQRLTYAAFAGDQQRLNSSE